MKIFLSYASEYRELAESIHLKLLNAGHEVFFDQQKLQPGLAYDLKIKDAIQRCDLFVFLLAPESIEPGSYALTEVGLVQRKWPNPEGRVLVVDLGNLAGRTVPPYLRSNILLSPKGDPATETLFAVQAMAEGSRVSPHEPSSLLRLARGGPRRMVSAAFAVVVVVGLWVVYQAMDRDEVKSVTAIGGVAAGQSISVGGNINIQSSAREEPSAGLNAKE